MSSRASDLAKKKKPISYHKNPFKTKSQIQNVVVECFTMPLFQWHVTHTLFLSHSVVFILFICCQSFISTSNFHTKFNIQQTHYDDRTTFSSFICILCVRFCVHFYLISTKEIRAIQFISTNFIYQMIKSLWMTICQSFCLSFSFYHIYWYICGNDFRPC